MYLIYGFRANIPERLLPIACEIVQTMSNWPTKSVAVMESVKNYGGMLFIRKPHCKVEDICVMCKHCVIEDRENLHRFLEEMYRLGQQEDFNLQLRLIKFLSLHTTGLFTKQPRMPAIAKILPSEYHFDHL